MNNVTIKTFEKESDIRNLRNYHQQILKNIGYFTESYDIIKQQNIAKAEGTGETIVSDSIEKREKIKLFQYFVQWCLVFLKEKYR